MVSLTTKDNIRLILMPLETCLSLLDRYNPLFLGGKLTFSIMREA